jgi:signal transduction histidine kinase
MVSEEDRALRDRIRLLILSVPISWKIIGIGILPVIVLGGSLNYWVTSGLSDWLSYILTDARVEAAMQAGSRSVMFVTAIAAFLSIIILMLLVYILANPIEDLRKTAEEVASGKFETRAEVWANDEIGSLAKSVNQMIDNFVEIHQDLSQTNQQLEAINKIASAADREKDIHDVLFITLESILNLLGLGVGWVYLYDPEVRKHHLASWKGVPKGLEQTLCHQDGDELCDCQQKIQDSLLGDQVMVLPCKRLSNCENLEFDATHISIPIAARNLQFGVINLHYPDGESIDQEDFELLTSIGTKISEVVANAWLQIKLKEKEAARLLLLESLVTAQEDERSHLARELHDQAGQSLTNLLIRLKAIENLSEEKAVKQQLRDVLGLISDTIDDIRDLSYSLRPPALEEFGLVAAIEALVEDISEQTGMKIRFKNRVEEKYPRNIEMVLFRIVQEGITNVVRHAEADEVIIEFEPRGNLAYIKIEDNGKGFDLLNITANKGKRHLGLISMNERAELIGGKLDVYSEIGMGTVIEVNVPIPEMDKVTTSE